MAPMFIGAFFIATFSTAIAGFAIELAGISSAIAGFAFELVGFFSLQLFFVKT